MGFIRASADWDWTEADKHFRRAVELNPSYWVAPYWYATILIYCGRVDYAEQQVQRARELEPFSPIVSHVAAAVALMSRRYNEAIDRCRKGLDIDPDYGMLRLWLGMACEQQSKYADAIREFETGLQSLGEAPFVVASLGHAHARAGNEAEARKLLQQLSELSEHVYIDAYLLALIHLGLGEQDRALECLEKACNNRSGFFTLFMVTDPRMDDLRADPRFQQLLRRMGLTHAAHSASR